MRQGIRSLLVAGCVASTALAIHASSGAGVGQACSLLTPDLVMKVAPETRKKALEREKPVVDPFAKELRAAGQTVKPGMSCMYGPVILALDPLPQPAQVRNALQARAKPYEAFEPVPGVGDAAFVRTNSGAVSMYVWSGPQHFLVEIIGNEAREWKTNSIELAKGIVSRLR